MEEKLPSVRVNVQSKVKCLFQVDVQNSLSSKRPTQGFNVVASNTILEEISSAELLTASATEKIDGTCCFIASYNDHVCLWARLDRKLNKIANKKWKNNLMKQRVNQDLGTGYSFKYPDDMKDVPELWMPAEKVDRNPITGEIVPDMNGHVPGWVPVHSDLKQYCWHNSVTDESQSFILVLKPFIDSKDNKSLKFSLTVDQITKYNGKTLELIGTNINANPYRLGSKKFPFHVLVEHGSIPVDGLSSQLDYDGIKRWFMNEESTNYDGNVEGIVWHCNNDRLFKVHRHHMGLPWPIKLSEEVTIATTPSLCRREVVVDSKLLQDIPNETRKNSLFNFVKSLNSKIFPSLLNLSVALQSF